MLNLNKETNKGYSKIFSKILKISGKKSNNLDQTLRNFQQNHKILKSCVEILNKTPKRF